MRTILTLLFLVCVVAVHADDERIFIDAKINGKPVRLAFDSGMGVDFALSSTTAQKLNLKVTAPPADTRIGPGQTLVEWTAPQKLDLGSTNIETGFAVLSVPPGTKPDFDGIIGWPAVRDNVLHLDCASHLFGPFTNALSELSGWVKCHIQSNPDLTLELPGENPPNEIIALDSGTIYGVKFNRKKWREWKAAHTHQPMTLTAYYAMNTGGLVVSEEAWADEISLGPLTLTDVPVTEATSGDIALHSSSTAQYEATLGFAALKRLDVVIDGIHGVAYLRPKDTPPMPYEYNRLGAVFAPKDLQSHDLLAHVIKRSPAYDAGIRNGDVLLKIDNRDVTDWRDDPNVKINSAFCDQPSGTKIELTLNRGGKIFRTTVTLQNIFPPDSAARSN
ncbi:MAG TPA: aspartyl protease family protein [Verrucomicrobiae bacterium]|nr:aspartyl protease family protein [Verrucomicrobiae bacterium]